MIREWISDKLDKISIWLAPINHYNNAFMIEIGESIYPADGYQEVLGGEGVPIGLIFWNEETIKRCMHVPYVIHIHADQEITPINPEKIDRFEGYF